MALRTLKTNVPMLETARIRVAEAKAGATERIRGRAWMATRQRILLRDGYKCQGCGVVRMDNEVDHRVPLEQGGAADEDGNLWVLCIECHKAKTRKESQERAGKR